MHDDITQDVNLIMRQVYENPPGQQNQEPEEEEEVIQVHHYPNAIVIIKEPGKSTSTNIPIVDSTPKAAQVNQASQLIPYLTVGIFLMLILSSLMFQFYVIFHPPTVTVTIIPRSQQINLTGTLQLGRVLSPITVSQEATTQATGKGHQDAAQATGTLTFYNGLFTQQFIAQGTVYTGSDGVQIVTTQDATIPPGNPTTGYGTVTVTAQAQQSGIGGNIPAGDINIKINNGLLVRNNLFSGGQDERNFTIVTQADINSVSTQLKTTLNQSTQGALQGQLKSDESLVTPTCTTTVTPDHRPGEEATTVKVTESETCSAVAYNAQALESSVTQLLTAQAERKLGTGYSLLGNPDITVTQATRQNTKVVLSFSCQGLWVYALATKEQQSIKKIIAGKTKERALQLLKNLPGIERVSMQMSGLGDDSRVPKDISHINILIFAGI